MFIDISIECSVNDMKKLCFIIFSVLKKEVSKNPQILKISMFGNTKPSTLRIVCALGCQNLLPVTKQTVDGKVFLLWDNVTSTTLPVVQIYLSDGRTLLFNDTVRGMIKKSLIISIIECLVY